MQIPIENIYYLLCYAWNKLDEKERVAVSIDDKTKLIDLLAKVLINATKLLLKRGIDKNYIDHTEEISGIKGKIQMSQTLKRRSLLYQKAICSFDEFSPNIITNRILITTLHNLTKTEGLDKTLKQEIVSLKRRLFGIDEIELHHSLFSSIKINRNNKFYAFIINVCQLVFESTLLTEEKGKYKFTDFTRDEKKMNQLFEAFIRNFYRIEQKKFSTVKKETIKWNFDISDSFSFSYLPQMETDITLENENEKIIIDAKYHRDTMAINYEKEKIKSANLYQLFSYLINQENESIKSLNTTGILLYPKIETDYDLDYQHKNHKIQIRTVNLNSNWKDISNRLLEIIDIKI